MGPTALLAVRNCQYLVIGRMLPSSLEVPHKRGNSITLTLSLLSDLASTRQAPIFRLSIIHIPEFRQGVGSGFRS